MTVEKLAAPPAEPQERVLADLLVEAGGRYHAELAPPERWREVARAGLPDPASAFAWQHCWVAVRDGTIAAVATVLPTDAVVAANRRDVLRLIAGSDGSDRPQLLDKLSRLAGALPQPPPRALYLGKLAVDPASRGQGVGRTLVDTALRQARATGTRLCLHVDADNTTAIALYRRCGLSVTAVGDSPMRVSLALMESS